jgi:Cysteine-rich secretory protein family
MNYLTAQFNFAGQNIAMRWQSGQTINVNTFVTDMINMWFNQHAFVRVSDVNSLASTQGGNGQTIGHFSAMSNEMQTHMGCAVASWNSATQAGMREFLLLCNYAFTNFLGRRIWATGAPGSACTRGRDPTFGNLCTINEPINVNDWRRSFPSDAFFAPLETEPLVEILN